MCPPGANAIAPSLGQDDGIEGLGQRGPVDIRRNRTAGREMGMPAEREISDTKYVRFSFQARKREIANSGSVNGDPQNNTQTTNVEV